MLVKGRKRVRGRKRVKGRKHWVHIKDGYYAITKILERKMKRDGSIICKVEWAGSLTKDWVSEDALCRKSYKIAKKMYLNVDDDDETDDELKPPEVKSMLPEKVKSDGGVKIKDEDTDNETDNDTHPSQVESNDKIKKENCGLYDDDTVNGEEQLEEVKSNNLDVKIKDEDTDNETDNNDTHPSQVESNDKIKKENYGPYDDDTVNGEKQPEEVKSDGGVKIKDEDTDNE